MLIKKIIVVSVINAKYAIPGNLRLLFNSQDKIVKFLFGGWMRNESHGV